MNTNPSLPRLHLVGGFLGSGKTTAIAAAAKMLADQGERVGIVTNDQGRYLVDTAFARAQDIPAMEVVGGCICVRLVDFIGRMDLLIERAHPQVIFAESVGSSVDLVETVVKPLLTQAGGKVHVTSFSVFTDARLLLRHLRGQELPFSEPVANLFRRQLQEAGLIVVNKTDLLSSAEDESLKVLLASGYPEKPAMYQNSLEKAQVANWLERVESGQASAPLQVLGLNLTLRAQGVQCLGWLSARLEICGSNSAAQLIAALFSALREEKIPIGHAKVLLTNDARRSVKFSLTAMDPNPLVEELADRCAALGAGRLDGLVNLRAECAPERLREIFKRIVLRQQAQKRQVTLTALEAFSPESPHAYERAV